MVGSWFYSSIIHCLDVINLKITIFHVVPTSCVVPKGQFGCEYTTVVVLYLKSIILVQFC